MALTFQVGQQFIVATDLSDPSTLSIYTCTKLTASTISAGPELVFYRDFCWPLSAKDKLLEIMKEKQKIKTATADSLKMVYQLRNKLFCGESVENWNPLDSFDWVLTHK